VSHPRKFDLVLHGASGFTGQLAAQELAAHAPAHLRWAVCGRSQARVAQIAQKHKVPALCADGLDRAAVDALAAQTRVVLSCAGPFSLYGNALVDACVKHGTHYADLSGELPWIHQLIARHHDACSAAGTTLIPASGFDSVPADLGVWALQQELGACVPIHGFFAIRGGFNGGTLHSGIALGERGELQADPLEQQPRRQVFPVPSLAAWAAPFLMAPVNESVVRRSAALLAPSTQAYGEGFAYHEHLLVRTRSKAHTMAVLLKLSNAMLNSSLGRKFLRRFGPKPGEGPSAQSIREGYARLTLLAGPLDQPLAQRRWFWNGDPSNQITVRCLVQTGLALAAGEAQRGGVLTPASALGATLLQRLFAIDAMRID
jgi:short subunit dehydrogenase-like uncharacterized protein